MQSPRSLGLVTLTIGGVDYPYVPGKSTFAQSMSVGGFSLDSATVFLIERSLFGALPKSAQLVTDNRDGKQYRIETVNDSTDGSHVVLTCVDKAQKL
jgi:hypothetical protein